LTGYLGDDGPPRNGFTGTVRAIPLYVPSPELWLLGSSEEGGAVLAAQRGMGFAYAHHINPRDSVHALRRYRETFVRSAHRGEPWGILALAVVCAKTDAEAKELARSGELAMVRFFQGIRDTPLPSVEEARAHVFDAHEEALRLRGEHAVIGGPRSVGDRLAQLVAEAQADEVMLLTHVHDHEARKRSYELVAEAFRVGR
jgi:luciferase family oxidoreductase group 1